MNKNELRLAVDATIFTIQEGELKVLLIKMKKQPFTGKWAFPGGLLEAKETTLAATQRILQAQTGVDNHYLEQLGCFDALDRDPAGRVVSVAYFALIRSEEVQLQTTDKYAEVRWWPIEKLPALAYDHSNMAKVALARLRSKVGYTNIVWSLLPLEFTLSELQQVYENVLGQTFDKRNFRKKILSLKIVKEVANKQRGGKHRPAQLYRFKARKLEYIEMI